MRTRKIPVLIQFLAILGLAKITKNPEFERGSLPRGFSGIDRRNESLDFSKRIPLGWIAIFVPLAVMIAIPLTLLSIVNDHNSTEPVMTPNDFKNADMLMEKYPTPASLRAALERGEVSFDSLPPDIREFMKPYYP